MLRKVLHEAQERLPAHARSALHTIGSQRRALASAVDRLEAQILAWHRSDAASTLMATIPGIGPITAAAIARPYRTRPCSGPDGSSQCGSA